MSNVFETMKSSPPDKTVTGNGGNVFTKMADGGEENSLAKNALGVAVGVPLIASGGALAIQGVKKVGGLIFDPVIKKHKIWNQQVKPVLQANGLRTDILPSELPAELKSALSREITLAKDGIVKSTVSNIVNNVDGFKQELWGNYASRLDKIQNTIQTTGLGVPLSADTFRDGVILKTAETLRSKGLQSEAAQLESYAERLGKGNPIQFSEAKQAITNLGSKNVKIGRELTGNFIEYLGTDKVASATPAAADFKALQSEYSAIKPTEKLISNLTKGGKLDTKVITNYVINHLEGKGNPETTAFLKQLGTKTPLSSGIPGLDAQATQLEQVAQKVAKLKTFQEQSGAILAQLKTQQNKINARTGIVKGVAKTAAGIGVGGVLGKGLGLFSNALPYVTAIPRGIEAGKLYPNDPIRQLYHMSGQDVSEEAFKKYRDNLIA